jgi:hypothetical protein
LDDFDLLADFPVEFDDVLDPEDLAEADLTVAELTALDGVAHSDAATWHFGPHDIKAAADQAAKISRGAAGLVGEADLTSALKDALQEWQQLPSPFRP